MKLLIANRGEIAVRIIRACREMSIDTVAVYSEVDRLAPHVLMADSSYPIGPAPAAQSYLDMDKLLAAAASSGAELLHPPVGVGNPDAEVLVDLHLASWQVQSTRPRTIAQRAHRNLVLIKIEAWNDSYTNFDLVAVDSEPLGDENLIRRREFTAFLRAFAERAKL